MKKLALLLGALSLVSSVAYAKEVVPAVEEVVVVEEAAPVAAAPALRVTSIGQYVEVDNKSGSSDIGEEVYFGNTVNFAYGDDWTFGLLAHKTWNMDTDKGTHGKDHRLQLDAWRNYENFSLGLRYRGQETYDRYYLRGKYSYGMFSGWADLAYQSNNSNDGDHEDSWYSEGMPIGVTVGPVTIGYYYEWDKMMNATSDPTDSYGPAGYESTLSHQLRVMAPLYTGEKLSLSAEYRWQFAQDVDYEGAKTPYNEKTAHIGILYAGYKVTDNLTLDGYYRYDFNEYEGKNTEDKADNYYGEFYAGWTYTF